MKEFFRDFQPNLAEGNLKSVSAVKALVTLQESRIVHGHVDVPGVDVYALLSVEVFVELGKGSGWSRPISTAPILFDGAKWAWCADKRGETFVVSGPNDDIVQEYNYMASAVSPAMVMMDMSWQGLTKMNMRDKSLIEHAIGKFREEIFGL